MFVAEALVNFSAEVMKAANNVDKGEQQKQKQEQKQQKTPNKQEDEQQNELKSKKRGRTNKQVAQFQNQLRKQQAQQRQQYEKSNEQQANDDVKYIQFSAGDKILVQKTFQNGWWFGHPVGKPDQTGFFPSNYVKVGAKPPPPPPPKDKQKKEDQIPQFDPNEGNQWIKKQLDQIKTGPVKSDYYQGIKGYKMVKIDQKNQNILKGNHVQFDVATGLARVPVKDQAPTAKAVRQMGYYFDYHQWNQQLNKNPQKKARPDPRKKKAKKLHLKMMD